MLETFLCLTEFALCVFIFHYLDLAKRLLIKTYAGDLSFVISKLHKGRYSSENMFFMRKKEFDCNEKKYILGFLR